MTYHNWHQHPNDFLIVISTRPDAEGNIRTSHLIVEYTPTGASISHIIEDKALNDQWALAMMQGGVTAVPMQTFNDQRLMKADRFRAYQTTSKIPN